jgi:hypothetical protein
MGTTRLDADKMRRMLASAVNPFGVVKDFAVGRVQAIVMVNGEEQLFDIDGLVLQAVPRIEASQASADRSGEFVRTPPRGRGKLRLVVNE